VQIPARPESARARVRARTPDLRCCLKRRSSSDPGCSAAGFVSPGSVIRLCAIAGSLDMPPMEDERPTMPARGVKRSRADALVDAIFVVPARSRALSSSPAHARSPGVQTFALIRGCARQSVAAPADRTALSHARRIGTTCSAIQSSAQFQTHMCLRLSVASACSSLYARVRHVALPRQRKLHSPSSIMPWTKIKPRRLPNRSAFPSHQPRSRGYPWIVYKNRAETTYTLGSSHARVRT
jgi:hypothetical protein